MSLAVEERDVFTAIASPARRKMLSILADSGELPLYKITPHFQMGRTAVSKHLTILKEADLVTERKIGRETRFRLNATPLQEVQEWVAFYEQFWKQRVTLLKQLLEEE